MPLSLRESFVESDLFDDSVERVYKTVLNESLMNQVESVRVVLEVTTHVTQNMSKKTQNMQKPFQARYVN